MLLDAALKGPTAFVSRECDRCDRSARIVNWHGEPTANAEKRRLVEESALRFRQTRGGEFLSPFEGLRGCQDLDDDRVYPLIAFLQIMICPLDRIARALACRPFATAGRDRRSSSDRVQRQPRQERPGILGIPARGEAVDKALEYTMHAFTPVLHEQLVIASVPGRGKLRGFAG